MPSECGVKQAHQQCKPIAVWKWLGEAGVEVEGSIFNLLGTRRHGAGKPFGTSHQPRLKLASAGTRNIVARRLISRLIFWKSLIQLRCAGRTGADSCRSACADHDVDAVHTDLLCWCFCVSELANAEPRFANGPTRITRLRWCLGSSSKCSRRTASMNWSLTLARLGITDYW